MPVMLILVLMWIGIGIFLLGCGYTIYRMV
jgi:hypothetical protein